MPRQTVNEKPKKFKKTLKEMAGYLKPYFPLILIAVVASVIATILQIIGPDKLKLITDEITKGLPKIVKGKPVVTAIDMDSVKSITLMLLIFYLSSLVLNLLQRFIMADVTQKISKSFREEIANKINRLPFSYFDNTTFGDILSRVTNDVDTISQSLNQSVGALLTSIVMLIGTVVMMIYNSGILTITTILSSLVGFVFITIIMKKSQKYFKEQQQNLGDINGQIEEVYTGHNVIKAYNAGARAVGEFEQTNTKLYTSAWKSQFLSGLMMPIMQFAGNFSYVMVCIVGGALAINGKISFGVIVAFMIYVRLFTNPLSDIAQSFNTLQRAAAAGERVFEFLNEEELEEENVTEKLEKAKGEVEFKNVRFGYDPEKIIIKDFSVKVNPGEKIAIVGPTGAGKTTIVNLLMRFYEINDGQILVDGIDTKNLSRENLRDQFCMVLQDSWVFEASVRENITFGEKDITDEELIDVCKRVNLDHFIRTLPQGYDTILDDKQSLSQGQLQLLTIARAMVSHAPMLILDEATSSVDTRTEIIVQDAMDELAKGRTSFVIAHRLSTIKNADLILVMKDGDIVEKGKHDELLKRDGFYAQLYNAQFERK
ncbi:MAG: ABC transporter ATP-binding protein [Finegoldia magna]|uniref:ABC transporter ATP-binding protein n=1 Tax=Finegoldia magna TaxID=1260 RepID=UPI0026ED7A7C|nr:ABC transporter ATP-binding protein [Finegoldia magna]MBS5776492.1 ABC transporter ATP-binding protein [Finegoldia magna]MDU2575706.1 ABC transporter ATP-binding protein [Finegoldia magna]MDU7479455.1 ABC transporter ATP-binding protein [Finegoldia magna]